MDEQQGFLIKKIVMPQAIIADRNCEQIMICKLHLEQIMIYKVKNIEHQQIQYAHTPEGFKYRKQRSNSKILFPFQINALYFFGITNPLINLRAYENNNNMTYSFSVSKALNN